MLPPPPHPSAWHVLTLPQALPDVPGLVSHARSVSKMELVAWGWGQRELRALPLYHQFCWTPAGVEDLGRENRWPHCPYQQEGGGSCLLMLGASLPHLVVKGWLPPVHPQEVGAPRPGCWERVSHLPSSRHVPAPRGSSLSKAMLEPRGDAYRPISTLTPSSTFLSTRRHCISSRALGA